MSARFSLRKRRKEIPAFAGMTSVCEAGGFLHTLFHGNDEYYSVGIVLYNADTSEIRPPQ